MELRDELLERARGFDSLSRWEKAELGRELRRLGLSYGEIMELIPVKKSTLATWCSEVTLTDEQIAAIKQRRSPEPGIPRDTQWRRREEIERIRRDAARQVRALIHDPQWLAGVILYWAEGSKTRNDFRVANSDPRALRLFISWVRCYLNEAAEFSLQLHLHEGNDDREARKFWARETGLGEVTFHKTFIKPKGTGHRKNHLSHGVCTVKMKRCADSWQRAMAWIEGTSTYLGLDLTPR